MDYLTLKYIHIVSSTILFGTGIGSAFYMHMANRKRDIAGIVFATRHVVIADWVFTTPAIVVQLASGLGLMHMGGYSLNNLWIMLGIALYLFAGACWLPVVWLQIRMRNIAITSMEKGSKIPDLYWQYDRWWIVFGALAFPAILIVFYLMIFKPG